MQSYDAALQTASSSPPSSPKGTAPAAGIAAHQQMMASCTGAILTSLTMTPFDVIKNRLQAQNQPQARNCSYVVSSYSAHGATSSSSSSSSSSASLSSSSSSPGRQHQYQPKYCEACGTPHAPRIRFRGTMDAFVQIGRFEGFHTLWRGVTPTLVMSVPGTVVYFSLYDQIRPHLGNGQLAPGACGAISRVFAATAVSPLELLRTKMQATQGVSYADAVRVIRATVTREGVVSLYRGLSSTLLRDVPFSALYWTGYELLRSRFGAAMHPQTFDPAAPPVGVSFTAGALAGSFAAVVTLPFDVIKTRQQSLIGEQIVTTAGGVSLEREPTAAIVRDIYRHYGLRGFFAGITPRVAKVAPACAIMISTYEFFKQFFREQNGTAAQP